MTDAGSFHDEWQARGMRVKRGPFKDTEGVVQSTYRPRVQVAFPKGSHSLLWLNVDDLEVKNGN